MKSFTFASILVFVLVLVHLSAADQRCRFNITYGAFVKETQYIVAQNLGFFDDEDVCVTFSAVFGSVQQFNSLAAGQYQVINTAFDNVVNRVVNQGLTLSVIGSDNKGPDLAVVLNTHNGVFTLADLNGKTLAVDAPNSGLVYTMRAVLAAHGLLLGQNYTFQVIGGGARFAALAAGSWLNPATNVTEPVYGTISAFPLSVTLPSYVIVPDGGRVKDVLYPVQLEVLAVNTTWAYDHPMNRLALVRFLRAYIKASLYILNSKNRDAVIEIIRQNITGDHTTATATKVYNVVVSDVGASYASRITRQGLVNIMNVRNQFEPFTPADNSTFNSEYMYEVLTPQSRGLIDLSFYREAFLTVDTDQLYEQLFDA